MVETFPSMDLIPVSPIINWRRASTMGTAEKVLTTYNVCIIHPQMFLIFLLCHFLL